MAFPGFPGNDFLGLSTKFFLFSSSFFEAGHKEATGINDTGTEMEFSFRGRFSY